MSNESKTGQLTYITQEGKVDREHQDLGRRLQVMLEDSDSSGIQSLTEFIEALTKHQDAEDEILKTRRPENWHAHVGIHSEFVVTATEILRKAEIKNCLNYTQIEGLLALFERHIVTLDADWIESGET